MLTIKDKSILAIKDKTENQGLTATNHDTVEKCCVPRVHRTRFEF